jgi:hypothetical protein
VVAVVPGDASKSIAELVRARTDRMVEDLAPARTPELLWVWLAAPLGLG